METAHILLLFTCGFPLLTAFTDQSTQLSTLQVLNVMSHSLFIRTQHIHTCLTDCSLIVCSTTYRGLFICKHRHTQIKARACERYSENTTAKTTKTLGNSTLYWDPGSLTGLKRSWHRGRSQFGHTQPQIIAPDCLHISVFLWDELSLEEKKHLEGNGTTLYF